MTDLLDMIGPLDEADAMEAYKAFVREHGYHPGLRYEGDDVYLVPLENCGVVKAEEPSRDYYRGVADAMDVIRAYDFPYTARVDHIAEKLAPKQETGT